MLSATMKRLLALVAALGLMSTTFAGAVNAAMIGTQSAVSTEQHVEYVDEIQSWLARDDVKQRLVGMGVEPAQAGERVASLTTSELQTLHAQIDELPAGAGVVEVIGIVFVVLLILELVGVTDIFSKI